MKNAEKGANFSKKEQEQHIAAKFQILINIY
jgi:hypothetical protein